MLDGNVYSDVPAPQALIGYTIAVDEVGQTRYEAGQLILVQMGQRPIIMTVIGVLDNYGTMLMIQPENSVFIPMEYVKTLARGGGYRIIMVEAVSAEDVDQLVEVIGYVFGGILKALGMKDRGALSLYMIQGVLVGVLGSLVGLVSGFEVSYLIPPMLEGFMAGSSPAGGHGAAPAGGMGAGFALSFTPIVSLSNIGVAISVSIAVTLLSSLYPAWRASRLRPVEALRYE